MDDSVATSATTRVLIARTSLVFRRKRTHYLSGSLYVRSCYTIFSRKATGVTRSRLGATACLKLRGGVRYASPVREADGIGLSPPREWWVRVARKSSPVGTTHLA